MVQSLAENEEGQELGSPLTSQTDMPVQREIHTAVEEGEGLRRAQRLTVDSPGGKQVSGIVYFCS